MNRHNRILAVGMALLCSACARQDSTEEAAQMAEAAPAAAVPAEAGPTDTGAAPAATAMPPAPASVQAAAATPVEGAPPEENPEDQAALAAADTDAVPGSPAATHAAMASHVDQPADANAKAERAHRTAALAAGAVSPALWRSEDAPGLQPPAPAMVRMGYIGISNTDPGVRVHFALKTEDDADYQNQSLAPRISQEFLCGKFSACSFKMFTQNKPPVIYPLLSPGRYVIFWDRSAARWNLHEWREQDQ